MSNPLWPTSSIGHGFSGDLPVAPTDDAWSPKKVFRDRNQLGSKRCEMDRKTLLCSYGPEGDARAFARIGIELEGNAMPALAATAYDRAFGLDPSDREMTETRSRLLDSLAVREHGLIFRYIPGGSFLMGSNQGDRDERPEHPVELSGFWISDVPISWAAYCRLMGWQLPPAACPMASRPKETRKNSSTVCSCCAKPTRSAAVLREPDNAGYRLACS